MAAMAVASGAPLAQIVSGRISASVPAPASGAIRRVNTSVGSVAGSLLGVRVNSLMSCASASLTGWFRGMRVTLSSTSAVHLAIWCGKAGGSCSVEAEFALPGAV